QSRHFIKRLQVEGNSRQSIASKLPMAIPMLIACFNHRLIDIEQLARAFCSVAVPILHDVRSTLTDAPLEPKTLLPGLLHTILGIGKPLLPTPLIEAGRDYNGEVLIPTARECAFYDVKAVTKHLGKTNIATHIFVSRWYIAACERIIPSIVGIKSQSRKKRDLILKGYLRGYRKTAFLCTEMWECFPKARKALIERAGSPEHFHGFFYCECMNYRATGMVDGPIIMAYLRVRANTDYKDNNVLLAIDMLLSSKYVPTTIDSDVLQFIVTNNRRDLVEKMEDTTFTPIALYIQFLGMDKILELGIHDAVRKNLVKTYFMLVNKPEQLLTLCPDHLELCSKHPLWEKHLCVPAFYTLLDTYKWWTPSMKGRKLKGQDREIKEQDGLLLRNFEKT